MHPAVVVPADLPMTWRDVMGMHLEFRVWNEGSVMYDLLKVL